MAKETEDQGKVVATNRKAYHDYFIEEKFEAGIVLKGTEVKSLRAGRANLGDAYGVVRKGDCWLEKLHISPYEPATRENADPQRSRQLLLHGREIRKIQSRIAERGLTLIPLSLYFKNGRAKLELGLGKGRKAYDKRQAIRERDEKRISDRQEKDRRR